MQGALECRPPERPIKPLSPEAHLLGWVAQREKSPQFGLSPPQPPKRTSRPYEHEVYSPRLRRHSCKPRPDIVDLCGIDIHRSDPVTTLRQGEGRAAGRCDAEHAAARREQRGFDAPILVHPAEKDGRTSRSAVQPAIPPKSFGLLRAWHYLVLLIRPPD